MADTTYRANGAQWVLSLPALLLFLGLLVVPIALTGMLSFNVFDAMSGTQNSYTLASYLEVLSDSFYYELFARTALMSLGVTAVCIAIGVPETLILSRMRPAWQGGFFVVILGPLLISVVVRTLGWSLLLGREGFINSALMALGLIDQPLQLMFTLTGVVIALTHVMMPFMVISVWSTLQKVDGQIAHAARSLGAGPVTTFRRVVLPQLMPGILSGGIIVFTLSASAFATPAMIGGRGVKVVTTAIYDEFLSTMNWPLGASIAVLLLIAIVFVVIGSNRLIERKFKQVFV
ncbi:ABC transporter permease [Pseudomonas putida]|jgi:putative spermidine/putrescine transport system permease protein|uniref:ABC transporter permease n=3 Tax=Pseudomonas TaxID=286 RepID=A0A178L749_9PSED|nr:MULTISPECIES: ABC transporter permease [Pseudomonas]AXQ47758.1 ABC transporter permease [Stenotrophomonas rhizophila]EGC00624.1 ABC transporter permease [Pseudomonas sp. TJI-51]EKT4524735.1 ABC transporter permease [Pseudomonas putida]EKY4192127.1 ABC transporter permease [Pseudomonas aeruginosa]ELF6208591.1 ABC transporter permease [Pseudomonas putida]